MKAASSGAQVFVAPKIDAGRVSGERALLVVVILFLFFFFLAAFLLFAAFHFIVVATVDGALRREGEGRGA